MSLEVQCLNVQNKDGQRSIVLCAFAFTFPWVETVCGASVRDACNFTTLHLHRCVHAKQTSVIQI